MEWMGISFSRTCSRTWLIALVGALLLWPAQPRAEQSPAPPSSSSLAGQRHATAAPDFPNAAAGSIAQNRYRNPYFGFSYEIPFGWVERTAEMQEDDSSNKAGSASAGKLLLAIFERPPEVSGDGVNSAVIIAAESAKSYPGLKAAVDYFAPLEEVTTAKGFKVVNQPYEFSVGSKKVAREDFSKEVGKITVLQSSLVVLEKGYVVSFTFIDDSENEAEELVEDLSFAAGGRPNRTPAGNSK
jgi:hypothetical protein